MGCVCLSKGKVFLLPLEGCLKTGPDGTQYYVIAALKIAITEISILIAVSDIAKIIYKAVLSN